MQNPPSTSEVIFKTYRYVYLAPDSKDASPIQIIDETSGEAAVVDPVEPTTVLEAVKSSGCSLKSVLTTHHHWDHSGGNVKLNQVWSHKQHLVSTRVFRWSTL